MLPLTIPRRTVNLIAIEAVSRRAISCLSDFLVHPYPRVSDPIPRVQSVHRLTSYDLHIDPRRHRRIFVSLFAGY